MGALIDLYTTLFVLAITALGVLMASVIALTQLLEAFLVSKSARKVVYSRLQAISYILIGLSALSTLAPVVLLSMSHHDFLPQLDLYVNGVFVSHWYIGTSVILFTLATVSVVVFIYRVSQYLIPVNAIAFLKENQGTDSVTDYFQRGSVTKPLPPLRLTFSILGDEEPTDGMSDDELRKKYEKDLKRYENDQDKLSKMENPLFPLEAYLTRSIRDGNVTISRKTLEALEEIIKIAVSNKKFKGAQSLVAYYKSVLENADELARSVGLRSVSVELLKSSSRVSDILIDHGNYAQVNILFEYWQALASEMLGGDSTIFKSCVGVMSETSRTLLRAKKATWEDVGDVIDNISRSLGWLGERLLEKPPERRALMNNNDYSTDFDQVMNAVLETGWGIRSDRPETYPLIHFDSLYVIANKLANYVSDEEYNSDNGNSLFSLLYDVYTCGESAVISGNTDGACLALLRLEEHIKIADKYNLKQHKQSALEQILRLGALAASHELKGLAHFMISRDAKDLSGAAMNVLSKQAAGYNLDHEASEILIKLVTGGGNYKKVKKYLADTGTALGTNFGMNLTDTGE